MNVSDLLKFLDVKEGLSGSLWLMGLLILIVPQGFADALEINPIPTSARGYRAIGTGVIFLL